MKTILLFGAGRSSTSLIKYLLERTEQDQIKLHIADQSIESIQQKIYQQKISQHTNDLATALDIKDEAARIQFIREADVVISMIPAFLHPIIPADCLKLEKHLVTAS